MAISFNGATKVITLSTSLLSIRTLWTEWVDWLLISDNSKYPIAFSQVGGDSIDATLGTSIPIYIFLKNGWKIKPQEANHTLVVNDGILVDDAGGDPFINTTGNYNVRINYSQPVQALTVATGGGSSLTLNQIENSTVLAKDSTVTDGVRSVKNHITAMTQ